MGGSQAPVAGSIIPWPSFKFVVLNEPWHVRFRLYFWSRSPTGPVLPFNLCPPSYISTIFDLKTKYEVCPKTPTSLRSQLAFFDIQKWANLFSFWRHFRLDTDLEIYAIFTWFSFCVSFGRFWKHLKVLAHSQIFHKNRVHRFFRLTRYWFWS